MEKSAVIDHSIGMAFKTMAEGRNFIEGTKIYTSKMKAPAGKKYYGRGRGDMGNGGFMDEDGIWNQFVCIDKADGGYKNEYFPHVKKGIWTEKCLLQGEKLVDWLATRGKDSTPIRLFLKNIEQGNYVCLGIFEYSFTDKVKTTVIWSKL